MNATGHNFLRNFKSSGAPIFGRSDRIIDMETSATRKITPGPGTYQKGSDFGYVERDPVYND